MIDPASDANSGSTGPADASADAPPVIPPPLPLPLPSQAGSAPSASGVPRAARQRSSRKWVALGVVAMGLVLLVAVFVAQRFIFRPRWSARVQGPSSSSVQPGRVDEGVRHWNERIGRVPWSIHVVEMDRSQADLGFHSALAMGKVLGVSRISDMARALPRSKGRAVAIVNGDFYERDNRTYAGDPRGLQIVDGELVSGPDTVAVWFDPAGAPQLGTVRDDFLVTWPNGQKLDFALNTQRRANAAVLYTPTYGDATRVAGGRDLILEKSGEGPWLPLVASETYHAKVREVSTTGNTKLEPETMVLSVGPQLLAKVPDLQPGAVVTISTRLIPELKGVMTAIAGGPALIEKGKAFADREPPAGTSGDYSQRSKYERHPRSAIGWNDQKVFLITVDGRQPGLSVGMTLAELAEYMVTKLKCTDGMNFDGGASASLWMSGNIVNDPCQNERAVANGLIVYRKPKGQ